MLPSTRRTGPIVLALAFMLGLGCQPGQPEQPSPASKPKPNGPGPAAKPEPEADRARAPDPSDSPPASALAKPPVAGVGFVVGPPVSEPASADVSAEVEVSGPIRAGGAAVVVGYRVEAKNEHEVVWHLHARVDFDGAAASEQLEHRRATAVTHAERVLVSAKPIATLADGRWLVDTWLSGGAGEDSYATVTDHSVVLVDPRARSAAVIWTGSESSLSEGGGACVRDGHHRFEVEGEVLVVSKIESTVADAERIAALGWGPEQCQPTPKARAVVARIPLSGA